MLTVLALSFQYTNFFSLSVFSNYYFPNLFSVGLQMKYSEHKKLLFHFLALNSGVVWWVENQNAGTCAYFSHCCSKFHQVKYNCIEFLELLHSIQKSVL